MTLKHPELDNWMAELDSWIREQPSPSLQADAAMSVVQQINDHLKVLRDTRTEAVRMLYGNGEWSYAEMAEMLGCSRQYIERMINR